MISARSLLRKGLVAVATVLVIATIGVLSLPLFFASSKVVRADVILHFAFNPQMRGDTYAAQLFRDGIAPSIICAGSQASWQVYPADWSRDHLISLGIPAEAISVLHLPIADCEAELVPILVEALRARGAKSAVIVTDPSATRFGTRRFVQRMADQGINATVTFAEEDRAEMLSGWWRSHWKAQRIVSSVMNSTIDLMYATCR